MQGIGFGVLHFFFFARFGVLATTQRDKGTQQSDEDEGCLQQGGISLRSIARFLAKILICSA